LKFISVVTPTFNEEKNVENAFLAIREVFSKHPDYRYEHLFIDNSSQDETVTRLKELAEKNRNLKIIVNTKNFGHVRSPYYGILQTDADAVVTIPCDLQDPPELIHEFIKKWEEGYKVIIGIKNRSEENPIMFFLRRVFYFSLKKFSSNEETVHIRNFHGFGLYDKSFVDILKKIRDPYPYFRGIVAELGFRRFEIPYTQRRREHGKSKSSFYVLYDAAMLAYVNHSKVPLRIAVFMGFGIAFMSFIFSVFYFIYKLLYWDSFPVGIAPLVIGLFFFSSVQLIFVGILGEYVSNILTQVKDRPLVVEKERVNFDAG
jgi:glycosyltransferase involved in cell wall biosynthesis